MTSILYAISRGLPLNWFMSKYCIHMAGAEWVAHGARILQVTQYDVEVID